MINYNTEIYMRKTNLLVVFLSLIMITGAMLFTSCGNFMKSGEVRKEIEEAIAYNNAQTCPITLKSEKEVGEFLTGAQVSVKEGYSVEFKYSLKYEDYVLVGFEAVCNTDATISRAAYVKITCEETDKKGIYNGTIKLLKKTDDIVIRPVFVAYPAVVSYTPLSNVKNNWANTPIHVTFNMEFTDATIFNYENIILTAFDEPVDELFEAPVLEADKKTITINPKGRNLQAFIEKKNAAVMNLSVSLTNKIVVTKNELKLPLKQDENTSFVVHYLPKVEEKAPEARDFFITKEAIFLADAASVTAAQKFTDQDITDQGELTNDQYSALVLKNLTRDTVYIYGCYYDEDSGVKQVKVVEQLTNNVFTGAPEYNEPSAPVYYTSQNAEFISNNGETRFCIKHKLTQPNGPVHLYVTVQDACENTSAVKDYVVVKKDKLANSYFFTVSNKNSIPGSFSEENLKTGIKRVSVSAWFGSEEYISIEVPAVYKKVLLPQDAYELKCEYIDKTGKLKVDTFTKVLNLTNEYRWDVDLDVDSVSGLAFKVIASDSLGNTLEKEYVYPKKDNSIYTIKQTSETNEWTQEVTYTYKYYLHQKDTLEDCYGLTVVEDSSGDVSISSIYNLKNSGTMAEGNSYRIVPSAPQDIYTAQDAKYGSVLYGEMESYTFSTDSYAASGSPVQIDKVELLSTDVPEYVNLVITLKTGTWENFKGAGKYLYVKAGLDQEFLYTNGSFIFDREKGTLSKKMDAYSLKDPKWAKVIGIDGVNEIESAFFEFPALTGEQLNEHDADKPYFYLYDVDDSHRKEDHYIFYIQDSLSGPDKGTIKIFQSNNTESKLLKTYSNVSGTPEFEIPVWDLMPVTGVYNNYEYEVKDKAGNTTNGQGYIYNYIYGDSIDLLKRYQDGSFSVKIYRAPGYGGTRTYVYELDPDTNAWSEFTTGNNIYNSSSKKEEQMLFEKYSDYDTYEGLVLLWNKSDYCEIKKFTNEYVDKIKELLKGEGIPQTCIGPVKINLYGYFQTNVTDNYTDEQCKQLLTSKGVPGDLISIYRENGKPSMADMDGNDYFELPEGQTLEDFIASVTSMSEITIGTQNIRVIIPITDSSYLPQEGSKYIGLMRPLNSALDGKFVKILTSRSEEIYKTLYLFNGDNPGTGKYDWLFDNPNSSDYVFISSDAPVFIYTAVTQMPYETCKDWSINEWESFKEHYGDEYCDFSTSDHAQRRYSIPLDKITDGSCYCVIAHFADNHVEKSKVFVK